MQMEREAFSGRTDSPMSLKPFVIDASGRLTAEALCECILAITLLHDGYAVRFAETLGFETRLLLR